MGTLNSPKLAVSLAPYSTLAPDLLGYGQQSYRLTTSLADQVDYFAESIERATEGSVVLLGHSVGGAIAMLLADRYPEKVAAVINVEGNFTLNDAFWSASVAKQPLEEVEALIDGFRADPAAWLSRAGAMPNTERLAEAESWLACQGGATVKAMGCAVVEATGRPDYLAALRRVFARIPVHLVAGEHSRDGWDVPDWALQQAASVTILPGLGHLMMLEDSALFGETVAALLAR